MENIKRTIKTDILAHLEPNKAVIIYGPRQVGKTTLVKEILAEFGEDYLFVSGEDINSQAWLSSRSIEMLKKNIGKKSLIVIDEAQKIERIGDNLKLMVDHIEGLRIIATGSSSFELANQIGEPLVGRKWTYNLFPIAQLELNEEENLAETKERLEDRLIYGSYPEIVRADGITEKRMALYEILNSYLYKDVFAFQGIRKAEKINALLKLIAFQIGKEVSISELGNSLDLDMRTVESYLDILEKAFVIKRVFGFARNLRKEVTKTSRFYFLDTGIRNAIIDNLNPLDSRDDSGQLWENYLFSERLKKREYEKIYAQAYFWRTYDRKEIDLVEERDGQLFGYEFKWGRKQPKAPKAWLENYPNASFEVIDRENYLDFIS
jgi:predicted AAA+ superfamily ATPase